MIERDKTRYKETDGLLSVCLPWGKKSSFGRMYEYMMIRFVLFMLRNLGFGP